MKALLRFPDVVRKLSDDLDWTTSLGDAIVNQPQDVANVIQELRAKAQNAGTLKTTKEQVVTTQKQDGRDVVTIELADPSVIYVPSYAPVAVYNPLPAEGIAAGLLTFGAAVAIGSAWRGNYWNWGTGAFYPPIWPGYPAWRPPYAGWRPGMPIGGGGNINIGDLPWRPDGGRYRPGGRPPGVGGGVGAARVSGAALAAARVSGVALAADRVCGATCASGRPTGSARAGVGWSSQPSATCARVPQRGLARLDMGTGLQHGLRTGLQHGLRTGQLGATCAMAAIAASGRAVTAASTADEAALGEASTEAEAVFTAVEVAFEVVAEAADGDPILGLSTRSSCSAISTTALASIASFIMEAKKPMSELSRRRCKR